MELSEIKDLAIELMYEHELIQDGWEFRFDNSKRRAGLCVEDRQNGNYISLSRVLMPLMKDEEVQDTILHEIAHALVGVKHGHNRVWVAKAKQIGCNGKRCYNPAAALKEGAKELIIAQSKYTFTCPKCGNQSAAHRKPKRSKACGHCCRKYNGGKYSEEYKLVLTQNY